ncbi:MAG: ribonuclease H-like domain-containing protein [Acidobacteriales bacterium]|nr:ribonuclease H-like domain-containing protein [Terriglobales bacterium]
MQLNAQDFLSLAERANSLCTFDLESTGTKGDYNSILCVTVKPWHAKPVSFVVDRPGNDRAILADVRDELHKYDCWVGYYSKGFDTPMLQSRLLVNRLKPLIKRPQVDMYYVMKYHTITGRRSQAHLLEWLNLKQKKMTLSPDLWVQVLKNPARNLPTLRKRCESDCAGLENLYDSCKHLIAEVTR